MAEQRNQEVIFASRPKETPTQENFKFKDCEYPNISNDGEFLVKTLYLSVDPYMRPKMTMENSYTEPYEQGKPMYGDAIAKVIDSRNNKFKKGDLVMGLLNWKKFDCITPTLVKQRDIVKLDTKGLDLPTNLGLLGMTGETAYCGLKYVGKPQQGQTVVVSAAAGAVGSVVGQLAKLKGCRVIGIAGGDEKVRLVKEKYRFDDCIDYKKAGDRLSECLKRFCPQGIDLYWDAVGGSTLDAVLENLKVGGRVVACGSISSYNKPQPIQNSWMFVAKRPTLKGFLVYDHKDKFDEARTELAKLYREGKLHYELSISHGLDQAVASLLGLFEGKNVGKAIVEVAKEESGAGAPSI
jgi:NADPH-dependent curcumin reductase CurA